MADFLVEIGTEELPPKSLVNLARSFHDLLTSGFRKNSLTFCKTKIFATPRRIAVLITDLDEQAPSREVVIWGPPVKIAFNGGGNPTAAGVAFAKKNNIVIESLAKMVENDRGQDKLCIKTVSLGAKTKEVAGTIIESALNALPIPKKMRWGSNSFEFVRPIHWVLVLFGKDVVKCQMMNLNSGNISYGHRFHSKGQLVIATPSEYQETLRCAYVIVDFEERKELIRSTVTEIAKKAGGTAVINDLLLEEVTALNEWPIALLGSFEEEFLAVPTEAIISSMAEHQKYFHLVNSDGKLLPMFITVSNLESKNPSEIVNGNERVIRPRLSDAAFFYDSDKKTSLEQKRASLKSIVFQEKLGSVYDKTVRLSMLAKYLAPIVGSDISLSVRTAELCKSDLVTDMVGEFESLQGVMGRYYAINDGEDSEVAEAILEHYMPKFSGDAVPGTSTGATLAIADRLDTLVGIFGIGQPPSGSKDPFALRRSSLGLLRIIVKHKIDLDLYKALEIAASQHSNLKDNDVVVSKQVLTYVLDRFKSWYEDEQIPVEVFLSVAARKLSNPLDIHQRVKAVYAFSAFPEAASLAAANKRVSNILTKNNGEDLPAQVDESLLVERAEQNLSKLLSALEKEIKPLLDDRSYSAALKLLSRLKAPVDNFFDNVMVMSDDKKTRVNRLVLLRQLRSLFLEVADISLLVPAK